MKFDKPLYVGRPNIGSQYRFQKRINEIFERRWLSNDGPLVKEFEEKIAAHIGASHCIAVCNATVGLEIAIRALELTGQVIVPSYTFIATAHALTWLGLQPVFADIDVQTHNIDPVSIKKLINSSTSGIIGVHLWGRPCDTDAISKIAKRHGLKVMYDAAHAFGSSKGEVMVGNFGECEVFSFHATKFLNSFEGGAIVTNNEELADKIRLMRNFGFQGFDNVISLGINGKMNEACAAMGLTSLESVNEFININSKNHACYRDNLSDIDGISLLEREDSGSHNFQYIVLEVDETRFGKTRDQIIEHLHQNNVIARKYFWPGCHEMDPYKSSEPDYFRRLKNTQLVAKRVIVLPTGETIDERIIQKICNIIFEYQKTHDS
jgi:dTDP-4-amino-4,6-dideoxygalactose transaminase